MKKYSEMQRELGPGKLAMPEPESFESTLLASVISSWDAYKHYYYINGISSDSTKISNIIERIDDDLMKLMDIEDVS